VLTSVLSYCDDFIHTVEKVFDKLACRYIFIRVAFIMRCAMQMVIYYPSGIAAFF